MTITHFSLIVADNALSEGEGNGARRGFTSVKAISTLNIAGRRSLGAFAAIADIWRAMGVLRVPERIPCQTDRVGQQKRQFYQRIPDSTGARTCSSFTSQRPV